MAWSWSYFLVISILLLCKPLGTEKVPNTRRTAIQDNTDKDNLNSNWNYLDYLQSTQMKERPGTQSRRYVKYGGNYGTTNRASNLFLELIKREVMLRHKKHRSAIRGGDKAEAFLQNDERNIQTQDCAQREWTSWGSWGLCTANCGDAIRYRSRLCEFVGYDLQAQGKKDCGEDSYAMCLSGDIEQSACQDLPPCQDVSSWGDWGACSVTCKEKPGTRERMFVTKTAGGVLMISDKNLEVESCVGSGEYCSGWAEWSPCIASCGTTSGTRHRIYLDSRQDGTIMLNPSKSQEERCQGQLEPCQAEKNSTYTTSAPELVNCEDFFQWSPWQRWSSCSVTCGQGIRRHDRGCAYIGPKVCSDKPCLWTATKSEMCDTEVPCCVPLQWTPWGHWGPCSSKCKQNKGTRNRQRSCQFFGKDGQVVCDDPLGVTCPGEDLQREECTDLPPCGHPRKEWSGWTQCSASCFGQVGVRGRVMISISKYGYWDTDGRQHETIGCLGSGPPCQEAGNSSTSIQKTCVNGQWTKLGKLTACSVTCGIGQQRRSRTCTNPAPNECGQTCQGFSYVDEPCQLKPCRKCAQFEWTPWQSWSQCSTSCGQADRSRQRSCQFPGNVRDGEECVLESSYNCKGSILEVQACKDNPECPKVKEQHPDMTSVNASICTSISWSAWGRWNYCTVYCGSGFQRRTRRGLNGTHQFHLETCPSFMTEIRPCEKEQCQLPCAMRSWSAWAPWTACDSICGLGNRIRDKYCVYQSHGNYTGMRDCGFDSYEDCSGDDLGEQACTSTQPCTFISYWAEWNDCSVSCRGDVGFRERMTYTESTSGSVSLSPVLNQIQSCTGVRTGCGQYNNASSCALVLWSSWQEWSSCPVTCGQGKRTRARECVKSDPEICSNMTCPGVPTQEELCDTDVPCCVPRRWTLWGAWGPCSRRCNLYKGIRNRQRSCQFFGKDGQVVCDEPLDDVACPGNYYQMEECDDLPPCEPRTEWSGWTKCSATCAKRKGVKGRVMLHFNQFGYGWTKGEVKEKDTCHVNESSCPGENSLNETKACVPVNGQWSGWGKWSYCSVKCGSGTRKQSRTCSNPPPNECGLTCQGFMQSVAPCKKKPCRKCAQRELTSWQPWSECSAPCGLANRSRQRACEFPNVKMDGKDCGDESSKNCEGSKSQEEACDGLPLCLDENSTLIGAKQCGGIEWSAWGSWSECTLTCGIGSQSRNRSCQNATVELCVEHCGSMTTEMRACQREPCHLECALRSWGTWGAWGACDSTCGNAAFRIRTKLCVFKEGDLIGRKDCGIDSEEYCDGDDIQEEACTGLPPCSSLSFWSAWGACSVSCRQEVGFRERMTYTESTSGWTSLTPSLKEIEACTGTKADCGEWTSWTVWSSCNCKTGKRSRDRKCVRGATGLEEDESSDAIEQQLPCEGSGYDDVTCNTTLICPACITSCVDTPQGIYPSCNSCSEYIRCGNNSSEHVLETCLGENTEWDGLNKTCVPGPSSTCSLHDCLEDCTGEKDHQKLHQVCYSCHHFAQCKEGRVVQHSCFKLMEFDARTKLCENYKAHTCKRRVGEGIKRGQSFKDGQQVEKLTKIEGEDQLISMPETKVTDKKEPRKTKKNKGRGKNKDRTRKKGGSKKKRKNRKNRVKVDVPDCVTGCKNLPKGRYPSCRSCKHFWQCSTTRNRERKCAKRRAWDNTSRKCLAVSTTCPGI